ncbi:hypothetical protein ABIB66_006485 [Bradyrhizobium sp. F1.13.3]
MRLTSSTRRQSVSDVSISGANTAMPALLTSASSRPNRRSSIAIAAATAAASETSQVNASVVSSRPISATARPSSSPSMSSSATRQPSVKNFFAVASPMPRAAPVTRAIFCGEAVIAYPWFGS